MMLSRYLLIASVAAMAAACAPVFNGEMQSINADARHPIAVDAQTVSMTIALDGVHHEISRADTARLRAFAQYYLTKGYGPLTVSMPSGSENTRQGVRITADIRNLLNEAGVPWSGIQGAQYRAAGDKKDAEIFLSFTRYVATASPCGAWTSDWARSYSNLAPANFGCATQHNLAAMVADPHDLISPFPMSPADAARRGVVLEKYRAGDITSAEEDQGSAGTVSDVEGGQ